MGVLAHRLRTLDRSLVPPSTRAEIFRRMCLQSHLQTPPPTPSEVISEVLEPLDNFSKYPPFPPKKRIVQGVGGVPEFFLGLES
jgi:hypothetical protein